MDPGHLNVCYDVAEQYQRFELRSRSTLKFGLS
jgi:hypothetical protein